MDKEYRCTERGEGIMYSIDPRYTVIKKRLENVKTVVGFVSNKGGVGKSVIAAVSSLILSAKGYRVGLFDMDFTNPSCHIILGVKDMMPIEEKGIIPPELRGIKFMSITYYTGENPLPLRGHDITNIILELLTITRWDSLDFLILDLPPGLGDEILDAIRFIDKLNIIAVTTPSVLSLSSVSKLIKLLKSVKKNIMGVIVNEAVPSSIDKNSLERFIGSLNVPLLGMIPFDPSLEKALGKYDKILSTNFKLHLERIVNNIINSF